MPQDVLDPVKTKPSSAHSIPGASYYVCLPFKGGETEAEKCDLARERSWVAPV